MAGRSQWFIACAKTQSRACVIAHYQVLTCHTNAYYPVSGGVKQKTQDPSRQLVGLDDTVLHFSTYQETEVACILRWGISSNSVDLRCGNT